MQFMERYLEDTLDLGTDRMILAPGWGEPDISRIPMRRCAGACSGCGKVL